MLKIADLVPLIHIVLITNPCSLYFEETYTYASGSSLNINCTVKPVYNGHSIIEKAKILMTNGSLMKVKCIAECSPNWC